MRTWIKDNIYLTIVILLVSIDLAIIIHAVNITIAAFSPMR